MAKETKLSGYRGEYWLSLERLSELMTLDGRTFPPYQIAREILYCEPLSANHERNEVCTILCDLIKEAESKMEEKGVEPGGITESLSNLPKRLRQDALLIGALYTFAIANVESREKVEELGERGAAWLQLSGDHLQTGIHWYELGKIHAGVMQPAGAVKAMETALTHAEQSGDSELHLRITVMFAGIALQRGNADKASTIIEQGMKVLEKNPSIERFRFHRSRLLTLRGRFHASQQQYEKAVHVLESALEDADEKQDPVNYCGIDSQLADIYQTLGDYTTALDHLNRAAAIAEQNNRVVISSLAWSKIGRVYTELQDYNQAREAFRFAHKHLPDYHATAHRRILEAEIECAVKAKATTEGITLCNQLLASLSDNDIGPHRSTTLISLGVLYMQLKKFRKARIYLEKAVRVLSTTNSNSRELWQTKSNLARIMIQQGETGAARTLLEEITSVQTTALADEVIRAEGLEMLSDVERLEGNFQSALEYMQASKELALEIAERKNTISIQNARVLVGIQMTQQQEKLQERQRKIAERELAQTLTMMNVMPLQVDRTEKQLHRTLGWLDPDLLKRVVVSQKEVANTWDVERGAKKKRALVKVQGVKPKFFMSLRERFPDLTSKQERLCGLIRSGLKTPEIAVLLNISEDGVWMQRKRLRKKLEIEKDVNLEKFLKNI
ncbi:MAG: tetratricopeptide repeat protein [Ignavibacteriae bacterium]|nr:tetratricopeptide repeat protein [Ignavibacteriota bacterium]MCB9216248.1 tetratricopeptide repeat protein [Ignavibacteria bacterium]